MTFGSVHHRPADAFRLAVLSALGYAPDEIEPGRLHRFATVDRLGDDSGWCKLFDDQRGGVFGDWRASVSEVWSADHRRSLSQVERDEYARQARVARAAHEMEQHRRWSRNRQRNEAIWAATRPLVWNDPVAQYLRHRGFGRMWPLPACLRFHLELPYWHDGGRITTHPAMLAPVVDVHGNILSLHRTYLTAVGRKATVPTDKKLTPASGHLHGACIPLFEAEGTPIGVSEGIETALGAHCASGLPVVAAYSAGALASWQWPLGVRRIVVFADADAAGRNAAAKLRDRVLAAGRHCEVLEPSVEGCDWADVWAAASSEETT